MAQKNNKNGIIVMICNIVIMIANYIMNLASSNDTVAMIADKAISVIC